MRDVGDVEIDGAMGEGGGQVLRSSLALSVATGRALTISNIRAGRKSPGLKAQHVASVRAAASICNAHVEGAEKGARWLRFAPSGVFGGTHRIDIGTAGATSLVAHTVIPALLATSTPATLIVTGGTHVPMSPPFEHLALAYAPALALMGSRVLVRLEAHGFMPEGGGRIVVDVEPGPAVPLILEERGAFRRQRLVVIAGDRIPPHVAGRETDAVLSGLARALGSVDVEHVRSPRAGNALALVLESAHVTDVFSAIGARGIRSDDVAREVVDDARAFLAGGAPVGPHLADQLLLPMALGAGGRFVTTTPTLHTTTNAEVIRRFVDVNITFDAVEGREGLVRVEVRT